MRLEQMQLKALEAMRHEMERSVESARETNDERLPVLEQQLVQAQETERQHIGFMKANGISIYPEDERQ